MKSVGPVFRLWMILSIGFVVMASLIVAGTLVFRTFSTELGERNVYRTIAQNIARREAAKLNSWNVHAARSQFERDLQNIIKKKATVKVIVSREKVDNHRANAMFVRFSEIKDLFSTRFSAPVSSPKALPVYLNVTLQWKNDWFNSIAEYVLPSLALVCLLLGVAWYIVFSIFRAKVFVPMVGKQIELERKAAIASSTQMLAHDVRKPFGILKMGFEALDSIEDDEERKKMTDAILGEARSSMAAVDGLLQDIMLIDGRIPLRAELASTTKFLQQCIVEVSKMKPKSKVTIEMKLTHTDRLAVDTVKMKRVVLNILSNAFEASPQNGRIWIKTRNLSVNGKRFVEVCIGNAGSYIPPEDVEKLFEAFFTKNKKGGNGLGLAIAKTIVDAHGGKIWCKSDKQKGVEFHFTLPAVSAEAFQTSEGTNAVRPVAMTHFSNIPETFSPRQKRSYRGFWARG